jgi:hypothetical protein
MITINYELAREEFINGYIQYEKTNDVSQLVQNVVIPYFEPLACDLEELIDEISSKFNNPKQVIDFIELIFNSKLYDSYLLGIGKKYVSENNYIHYLIILIEFIKYEQYQKIKNTLNQLELSQNEKDKTIIQEVLMKATDERSQYCLDKIKSTYQDLKINYSNCVNSILAADSLISSNNLSI